jgi:hypothetical protein
MKSRMIWVVAGGAVVILLAAALALRGGHTAQRSHPAGEVADTDEAVNAVAPEYPQRGAAELAAGGSRSTRGNRPQTAARAPGAPQPVIAQENAMPTGGPAPAVVLSKDPPAADSSGDDASPSLGQVLAVTKPDAQQESQIRQLWKAHEDARRALLAKPPLSAAPAEVTLKLPLRRLDGEFEMALVSKKVLSQDQIDRLVEALHPSAPPAPK